MRPLSLTKLLCPVALLILATSCGQSSASGNSSGTQSPCDKSSSIKGSIVTISYTSSGNFVGGLLLDGSKERQAAFTQVYVNVRSTTQVFEKQQGECRTIAFTTLKKGQRIQIQSTGVAAQSYPPQIEATEILILTSTT